MRGGLERGTLFGMHDSVSSPATPSPGPLRSVLAFAADLVAERHPGVRPPLDVRQTFALMFTVIPVHGLLGYLLWELLDDGLPSAVGNDLRTLLVVTACSALLLAALAVPVLRGGHILWRLAQAGALVALGNGLGALQVSSKLADTTLLLGALLAVLTTVVLNIALWSTEVRRWCGAVPVPGAKAVSPGTADPAAKGLVPFAPAAARQERPLSESAGPAVSASADPGENPGAEPEERNGTQD